MAWKVVRVVFGYTEVHDYISQGLMRQSENNAGHTNSQVYNKIIIIHFHSVCIKHPNLWRESELRKMVYYFYISTKKFVQHNFRNFDKYFIYVTFFFRP